jgi:hypothetical protein
MNDEYNNNINLQQSTKHFKVRNINFKVRNINFNVKYFAMSQ